MADLRAKIEEQIRTTHVLMYCKTTCGFCSKVGPEEGEGRGGRSLWLAIMGWWMWIRVDCVCEAEGRGRRGRGVQGVDG